MTQPDASTTAEEAEIDYRPLPPYGTPEFGTEIARRMATPCRMYTVEEAMAKLDALIDARRSQA